MVSQEPVSDLKRVSSNGKVINIHYNLSAQSIMVKTA